MLNKELLSIHESNSSVSADVAYRYEEEFDDAPGGSMDFITVTKEYRATFDKVLEYRIGGNTFRISSMVEDLLNDSSYLSYGWDESCPSDFRITISWKDSSGSTGSAKFKYVSGYYGKLQSDTRRIGLSNFNNKRITIVADPPPTRIS